VLDVRPCGPGAPTLALRSWSDPRTTMAKEPGHQGARNKPLKPLRREGRMIPATPVVTTVCFHTGRGCTGVFPGPSYFEGRFSCTAWAVHAARSRVRVGAPIVARPSRRIALRCSSGRLHVVTPCQTLMARRRGAPSRTMRPPGDWLGN
jgi:hypothetical protein